MVYSGVVFVNFIPHLEVKCHFERIIRSQVLFYLLAVSSDSFPSVHFPANFSVSCSFALVIFLRNSKLRAAVRLLCKKQ